MPTTQNLEMEMLGFGCASCVYTIEKMGRKIPGVDSIHVNLGDQRIRIEHHGEHHDIVARIADIVKRIGHDVREVQA